MKLTPDALIAKEKLTAYLLLKLPENDKSAFLGRAGYTLDDPVKLELDILDQLLTLEAELMERTEYGEKYCIRGELSGPNGQKLSVVSIRMTEDATGVTKFITLYPAKKR